MQLHDMSCIGASTGDMTNPQNVTIGINPPQLSALNSSTSVVSLQIGGNDIGFSSIIGNCAAWTPSGPTKTGNTSCEQYYTSTGTDRLLAAIDNAAPKIGTVLNEIHTDAPSAKVFVLGYPDIVPSSGPGCWPSMPLTTTDVGYLFKTEAELDAMIASEAAQHDATYVDVYSPSITHNACEPESQRWVEPIIPDSPAAPVHPNARGEEYMGFFLAVAMIRAGIY